MQWSPEKQWSPFLPTGKKQLSIRYLLAATAVVAILCVTIKATGIAFGFLTQNEFPAIMLAYVFGSLPVICLFSLVLVVTLTTLSLTRRWILHGSLAIFVAAMPLLLHGLIEFVFKLFLSQSFPAIKMDDMLQCYCFVGGFTVSLFVILLHARLQGLRLSFPQSASASVNSVARHSVP